MKRLILLRHARAATNAGNDFARPLAPEGRLELAGIATYLGAGLPGAEAPDLALVSPAQRTRETWDLVRARLPGVEALYEEDIYEAETEDLLDILQDVDGLLPGRVVETIVLVGHNPGITSLALELVQTGEERLRAQLGLGMPTASVAVLDIEAETWRDVKMQSARLVDFVSPESRALPA